MCTHRCSGPDHGCVMGAYNMCAHTHISGVSSMTPYEQRCSKGPKIGPYLGLKQGVFVHVCSQGSKGVSGPDPGVHRCTPRSRVLETPDPRVVTEEWAVERGPGEGPGDPRSRGPETGGPRI